MLMKEALLKVSEDKEIRIRVAGAGENETLFVECEETGPFLHYLTSGEFQQDPDFQSQVYVTGVVTANDGASFGLHDPHGALIDEFLTLNSADAKRLLLDQMFER